jgi:replicative DNA helicase
VSELRESGDIEQDASVLILLWNWSEKDLREKGLKVEKNRQGQQMRIGLTSLYRGKRLKKYGWTSRRLLPGTPIRR